MVFEGRGSIVLLKFHDMLLSSFHSYFLHVSFISFHLPPHHQLLILFPSPCFYRLLFSNLTVPLPRGQTPSCSKYFIHSFFFPLIASIITFPYFTTFLSFLPNSFVPSILCWTSFWVLLQVCHCIISKR